MSEGTAFATGWIFILSTAAAFIAAAVEIINRYDLSKPMSLLTVLVAVVGLYAYLRFVGFCMDDYLKRHPINK